jgi:peptidyl-prolyl cis-trans isomerase SDCCAG10
MSQVYATEPSTAGRVVFETTHGPIDIQLWSRECPLTTRCFLQLCLDGYYNNCLWHRIVPNFLIQTGAIRSNELQDDESTKKQRSNLVATYRQAIHAQTALERRQYELQSRLMFRRRGLVAMALGVQEDEDDLDATGSSERGWMQPQFFITLEEAPYLNGKHIIFGSVSGPTIFNVVRIATKTHVNEETAQPVEMENAPRIQSVKVMENPFPDLQEITTKHKKITLPWALTKQSESQAASKKRKRKGIKNTNVLSFGSELEEESMISFGGIKSRHDVEIEPSKREADDSKKPEEQRLASPASHPENGPSQKEKMTEDKHGDSPKLKTDCGEGKIQSAHQSQKLPPPAETFQKVNTSSETRQQSHKAEANSNHEVTGSSQPVSRSSMPPPSSTPKLSMVEARRLKYANRTTANSKKQREEDTMSKLLAFKSKFFKQVSHIETTVDSVSNNQVDNSLAARMARRAQAEQQKQPVRSDEPIAPTYRGQILETSDDEGDRKTDWLKTKFKCRKHMDLDSKGLGEDAVAGDGRHMEDYEVVDEKRQSHRRHQSNHNKNRGYQNNSNRTKRHENM